MEQYLKSFVIGSSFPVFFTFFLSVAMLGKDKRNYSYKTYTFVAPLYLGFTNALSLYIAKKYNLNLRQRMICIWLISATIVTSLATLVKSYNLDTVGWIGYYLNIFIRHFVAFNIVIYLLEKYI